jgi:ElaB/YqjD/DUF883 family membrane-anchored ribosome-binding protein
MNTSKAKSSEVADTPAAEPAVGPDALATEIAALRKEFKALLAQVESVGLVARDEAKAVVRTQAARGVEAGERVKAELVDEWREIDRRVALAAREDPWRSLGFAALAGLVLGLVLRR